jgi:Tol biopolymer transport system component
MQTDGTGVSRLTFQDGTLDYPSWDPHSRRLAFSVSNSSGSDGVYTLNLDNSGLTRLTFGATTSDGLPSWSTDGSQVVFQSRRDGNVQLYVMNADGTEQTRLMVSNRADEFPRWSR